jgi:SprT protein
VKTPVPKDLIAKVEDKVLETYIKAEEIWQRQFELPRLQFDLRGLCAGRAYIHHIRLNSVLLVQNETDFIEATVPHEVAHLISHRLHGYRIKPHGKEWKSVMLALGLNPTVYHNYAVPCDRVRRERRFTYACDCRSIQETARSHFKLQRGEIQYQGPCKYCGEAFKFMPDMGNRETFLNAQGRP